ncbi:TonB-dependent receptor [Flavobacterium gawalongense]|uniref:TonB-dependent receptor n=1 Tax=Flavobacterium gawalongense TaxID=2594432 RepID=A0A553BTI0_9FLAO|nr:TonB-dependent receptor [Flavobacterium gawalongense]TRX02153.1 TonB-dependent receptor [Flavobacterium gawalongense]TRX07382.1 TonB-dependent receptor [Flavobacterium gawalongense]TRX11550.1 TonB-dependent receptor [Flavobacterium gawalongense]TRX12447.1 TonB-dependent receptor [Flavobacterium gawalongense]TRX30287.1 TonB-dependent receptor [Flavobacterium gawalongense]
MKKSLLIILVLTVNIAFAQRIVTGVITDKTNRPIESVKVSVKNTDLKTFTAATGAYSIEVPAAYGTLEFAKENFKVQVVEITDDVVDLNMTLIADTDLFELSLDELMNIEVITASKKSENKKIAPATIYVVTEKDIIENGYTDLTSLLENVPGVVAIRTDHFAFGGQRGFLSNFSQTLLLVNGREMQNLIASETFIATQFATHNIKQVEILQGPASALYGANALVGVINIITKNDSADFNATEYHAGIGTQQTQSHSIVFGKNLNDFRISGSFRYFRSDLWDYKDFIKDTINFRQGVPAKAFPVNQQFEQTSWSLPYAAKISYKGFYVGIEGYELRGSRGLENITLDYKAQYDYRQLALYYAGMDKVITAKLKINTELQFYKERFWGLNTSFNKAIYDTLVKNGHNPDLPLTDQEIQENFMDIYSQQSSSGSKRYKGNIQLNYVPSQTLSIIGGYTFDMFDLLGIALSTDRLNPDFNETRSIDNSMRKPFFRQYKNSLFLQLQKTLFDKFYLTLGGRFDYHNIYKSIFTFRSGLVYTPFQKTSIKFLFGQAFREPTIFELGNLSINNKTATIDPVRMNTFEIGINQSFTSNLVMNIVAYKNTATNFIEPAATTSFRNSDKVINVFGIESQLFYKIGKIRTEIGYSYVQKDADDYAGASTVNLGVYKHRITGGLTYNATDTFTINSRINYYSEIQAKHGNKDIMQIITIPSYTKIDLTFSYVKIKVYDAEITTQLLVTNLFDSTFYQPDIRLGGPKQFLQHGRQLFCNLIFKF